MIIFGWFSCMALVLECTAAGQDAWIAERRDMLKEIAEDVRRTAGYTGRSQLSERVMRQMEAVPRHEFVLPSERSRAYLNTPLPIAHGQTISQPLIVALMTDLLETRPGDVVLEVGTGSGYQAAVLSGLVKKVYSIEVIPELARSASEVLKRLGYDNVSVKAGDGYLGWPEQAPFDGIIVTAAPDEIPAPLLEQLAPGGRLVIPVGEVHGNQELLLLQKSADGKTTSRSVLPVRFVPLVSPRLGKPGG